MLGSKTLLATTCLVLLPSALGCFQTVKECPNENVTFWLYTRLTQYSPILLSVNDPNGIKRALNDSSILLKFIIHGLGGNQNDSTNQDIRPAFFKVGDFNVISVDYSRLTQSECLLDSTYNAHVVGNCTAQLIDTIILFTPYRLNDIHIIGRSLGGQTLKFVSQYLKSGPPFWLTALDPANLIFQDEEEFLNSNDGVFIDIYHTDGGRKGVIKPLGTVDFYINGGIEQPACRLNDSNDALGTCSHKISSTYYGEAIASSVGFYGRQCPLGWHFYWLCKILHKPIPLGLNVPKTASGVFYVKTSDTAPYALGCSA